MKNKSFVRVISLALILCLSVITLSSCSSNNNTSTENALDSDPFIPIEGEEENGLVYHRETKTVYVLFKESSGLNEYGGPAVGYGYLAAYIKNGHFCEYVDGEIVEIIP